jgi:hypothetical protein
VGKTTLVQELWKNEYKSYLLIDFTKDLDLFKKVFRKGIRDLNSFFFTLQAVFGITFYERDTLIIFDEV